MKNIIIFVILCYGTVALAQEVKAPYELSNSEKLSLTAYTIFKKNKFLDFKDKDTLTETIDGKIYKKTALATFFSRRKDWTKIENEDTTAYRKPFEKYSVTQYQYDYTDSTMIETYLRPSVNYNMHVELKTVYNPKGFIIYEEKKIFLDGKAINTASTTNIFDKQNRVVKVIEKNKKERENKSDSIITNVVYDGNSVIVNTAMGSVTCKLF